MTTLTQQERLGLESEGQGTNPLCGTSPRIQAELPNESCSSAKTENLLHLPSPHGLRAAIVIPLFLCNTSEFIKHFHRVYFLSSSTIS